MVMKIPYHYKKLKLGFTVLLCLVTFFINNQVLVPDIMESRNLITAREMVYDGHWIVPTMNGDLRLEKPPLPTWLTAVAEIVSPDNVALARAMAGLAALLLVSYFWRFSRRILRLDPFVPTLLLCTCYNVILMGRTASWDIYCHAFMMGGIYHFARAMSARRCDWWQFFWAGILTGFSILSKGPVSLYALFLPFILSFCIFRHASMRGKWCALVMMIVVSLLVGGWWYVYVHVVEADALSRVVEKESGSWINRNVRPWWYYWKFFLETGVWSLLLLTSIFLPLFNRRRRTSRRWLLTLCWMLFSLVLLSVLPEKKSRYLLPILIPACYVMGCMLVWWKAAFMSLRKSDLADRVLYRVNSGLIAAVMFALPVAGWIFGVQPGHLNIGLWIGFSVIDIILAIWATVATIRLKPMIMLLSVTLLFMAAECTVMPLMGSIVNNPDMRSISATRTMSELKALPFYHLDNEELRIELVYAAHRPIRAMNADSLAAKTPCVVLTHSRAGDALPERLWESVDSVYVGRFDDNRRPKENKRYSDTFIYHATILRPRPQAEDAPQ